MDGGTLVDGVVVMLEQADDRICPYSHGSKLIITQEQINFLHLFFNLASSFSNLFFYFDESLPMGTGYCIPAASTAQSFKHPSPRKLGSDSFRH